MRVHTNWLKSLINAAPALASRVYVTVAVNADGAPVKLPYVVIHPTDGRDDTDRLAGPDVTQHPRWVIHSVGADYNQAAGAGELVKSLLIVNGLGVIPTIPGEIAGRAWYSVPQPVQTDDDVNPPLVFHTAEAGFESTPTA